MIYQGSNDDLVRYIETYTFGDQHTMRSIHEASVDKTEMWASTWARQHKNTMESAKNGQKFFRMCQKPKNATLLGVKLD